METSSSASDPTSQSVDLGTSSSEQSSSSQIQVPTLTAEMVSKMDPPMLQLFQTMANRITALSSAALQGEVFKEPLNGIKIKKFSGKLADYRYFRISLVRHLMARHQKRFIEQDIYQSSAPPTPQQIAEDMDVQLFIAGNCPNSLKDHLQYKAKSACHMLELLDAQYGQASQYLIDEAVNFIRTGHLSSFSNLEEFIYRFEDALDVMEQNGMGMTDKAKSKLFFFGIGEVGSELEEYTLTNKLNHDQVLGHVRGYFSSIEAEHVQFAVQPGAGRKRKRNWRYCKRGGKAGVRGRVGYKGRIMKIQKLQ